MTDDLDAIPPLNDSLDEFQGLTDEDGDALNEAVGEETEFIDIRGQFLDWAA